MGSAGFLEKSRLVSQKELIGIAQMESWLCFRERNRMGGREGAKDVKKPVSDIAQW